MDKNKILVPYNFTDMDKKVLDFIVQTYVKNENVHITLFHTHAPIPEMILSKNSVMEKMSNSLHYLRQQLIEQENKIIGVRQHLLDDGFQKNQVDYLFQPKKGDLAREIILLAKNETYNTIVLNRVGNVTGFFKASVFNKVVTSLKDANIIIIT